MTWKVHVLEVQEKVLKRLNGLVIHLWRVIKRRYGELGASMAVVLRLFSFGSLIDQFYRFNGQLKKNVLPEEGRDGTRGWDLFILG